MDKDQFSMRIKFFTTLVAALSLVLPAAAQLSSFRPGEIWPDDKGVHINAHGGGVLLHDGVYYWFGEHKTAGRAGHFQEGRAFCPPLERRMGLVCL